MIRTPKRPAVGVLTLLTLVGCAGLLSGFAPVLRADVRITEFLASNGSGLTDEDGAFSDWIELHNSGPAPVNLGGWFLTDSIARPAKWTFPPALLPAGGYLVVFASEKDRRASGQPLHTNFKLAADGEYLALLDPATNVVSAFAPAFPRQAADVSFGLGPATEPVMLVSALTPARWLVPADGILGQEWIVPEFEDTTWNVGFSAIGYETAPEDYAQLIQTDVRQAMAGRNGSAYVRIPFVVTNVTELAGWRLRLRYDDGFVAWLNGAEIARRNAPEVPVWNSLAAANHPDAEALIAEDLDLAPFVDRLATGTNWLVLHGMNVTLGSSDFLLEPQLTAERTVSAQATWRYFIQPTPGAANRGGGTSVGPLLREVAHVPLEPVPGEPLRVTARVVPTFDGIASVTLRYRVMFGPEIVLSMVDDGTGADGTAGDAVFTGLIPADAAAAGQMIRYTVTGTDAAGHDSRAPLFLDTLDSEQYLGTVVTDSTVESRLPVVHLFMENPSASEGWAGTRCSLFHLGELYDNVSIRVHGQSSSGFPKKSHNLDFPRDHRFLARTNLARVKDVKLMTNWGDKSRVRNTLAYDFIAAAGSVGHFAWPVRVQRNGEFHAILDLMEDADDRWLERVGRDPEGALYKVYDALSSAGSSEKKTRKEEDASDLQAFINALAESRPLADRVRYACDNVDLPQTVSYFVALALVSSQDHGHKNFFVYRDTPGTGEWMLFPWDVDLTWGRNWLDSTGYFSDTLYQDNVLSFYNPAQQGKPGNRLYNLIFRHPDFRRMVLRRLRTVMDTVLRESGTPPEQRPIERRIGELLDLMDPPELATTDADLDYLKWGSWGNRNRARPEAQRILDIHLPGRRTFLFTNPAARLEGEGIPPSQPANVAVRFTRADFNPVSGDQAAEFVELTNAEPFAVDISGWQLGGAVRHPFRPGTVIPAGQALCVSPDPRAFRARSVSPRGGEGVLVQGAYHGRLSARGETLFLHDGAGLPVDAFTYAGAPTAAQRFLRVTEIMFNPAPPPAGSTNIAQDFEFVELQNIGAEALDLSGVRLAEGIGFEFGGSVVTNLPAGGFVVVAKNLGAFRARYGSELPVAGEFTGSLDNSGERLRVDDGVGEKVLEFVFDDTWAPAADGSGRSLVVVDSDAEWTAWGEASQWRASTDIGGSPGRADEPATAMDSDSDGLPDAWELANGLDPRVADSGLDPDGDGATHRAEFIAGTNPRDADSVLRLTVFPLPDGTVRLRFPAAPNRHHRLQGCDDLRLREWRLLADYAPADTSRTQEFIHAFPAPVARFYQVEVERAE